MPDSVFVLDEQRTSFRLVRLLPPSNKEILRLTERLARRVTALLQRRFATIEPAEGDLLEGAIGEGMLFVDVVGIFLLLLPVAVDTFAVLVLHLGGVAGLLVLGLVVEIVPPLSPSPPSSLLRPPKHVACTIRELANKLEDRETSV